MAATRGKRGRRPSPKRKKEQVSADWEPKTKLGRMVRKGEISSMSDALKTGLPIRESEIVDLLIPDLEDEVLDVNMVQRMTDSGRRVKFVITVAVGNKDGYVGFGQSKGKEVGSSIRKAIDNAKSNIMEIRRGCGSWECGCGKPHTVPFAITGKSGSVEITLKPAPHGIGLATGDVAKKILILAGVEDCWTFTRGKTKTTVNYAKAVFDALQENVQMRVLDRKIKNVVIAQGSIGPKEKQPVEMKTKEPESKAKKDTGKKEEVKIKVDDKEEK